MTGSDCLVSRLTHGGAVVRAAVGALVALFALVLCGVLASSAWAAADPSNKISFKFEGCDLAAGESLPNGSGDFVCADSSYNAGNLGKGWNELDLVPYRLTVGNSGAGSETFSIAIAADAFEAGHPGYDVISEPEVNALISTSGGAGCVVSSGGQQTLAPGIGGIDQSIYRVLTITVPAGSTCVLDYYERLALGSHLFPGASLHSNLLNQNLGVQGIGAKDRSIPVNEILPQDLDKTMTASQDQDVHWAISKDASPVNLALNDCLAGQDQAAVSITVNYTKLAPQPDGTIQVITTITATNPAHRPITLNLSDVIRSGATVLETEVFDPFVVAADASHDFVHTTTVASGTTDLNDVATATYTDEATGIAVPGQTTAAATATVQPSNTVPNSSATVSDVESITGAGLSYRVDSTTDSSGSFATGALPPAGVPYGVPVLPGPFTTSDVYWKSGTKTASGSVTFAKTVKFDGSASTSGTLSDVATVTGSDGFTASSNAAVAITATKCAKLTIKKLTDPASDAQDFDFDLTGAGVPADLDLDTDPASVATPSEQSYTLSPAQLGAHTVSETALAGWSLTGLVCTGAGGDSSTSLANRTATLDIDPGEDVVCTFTNTKHASLTVVKVTDPASDPQDFDFDLTGAGVPADLDLDTDAANATLPSQDTFDLDASKLGAHTVSETAQAGWGLTNLVCTGAGGDSSSSVANRTATLDIDAGEHVVCTFTNTKGASLTVVKVTDPASDPQDFDFDLTGAGVPADLDLDTDAANATLPSQDTFDLDASKLGAHTVSESAQAGWGLTNLICTGAGGDSSTSLANRTATLDIDAGETVVCTYTNTKHASLTVRKVTDPASDPQDFDFDLTGAGVPADLDLDTDGGNATLPSQDTFVLDASQLGAHTVSESALPDWDLTALACTGAGGDSSTSLANRTATLDIDAGETVVCTYTNTKHASLTVRKVTDPASDPQDFDFDLTGAGVPADLDLDTDGGNATLPSQDTFVLDASQLGAHTVSESALPDWDLTALACTGAGGDSSTSLANRTATLDIDAGETVVCTYTNTKHASLTVRKVTDPASDAQDFDFDLTGSGVPADLDLDTDGGNATLPSQDTFDLDASELGAHTVSESALPDWDLTALACTGGGGDSSTNLVNRKATLDIDAGETVVCTFTNTKRAEVEIVKVTDPTPVDKDFAFATTGGPNAGDLGSFSLNTADDPSTGVVYVRPGSYSVTETVPENWDLTTVVCQGDADSAGDAGNEQAD